jgi:hypothetical protein
MILDFVHFLAEAKDPRTPHPEDSIFNGAQAAVQALQGLQSVIANPGGLTIKWDGFPALIFGRTPEGKLAVMDKYMFDKGVLATSPQDWQTYDQNKPSGTVRPELYAKLANIWRGLDAAVTGPGFYWGDLLYAQQLQPIKGAFVFKPNLVEYHVPVNSALGQLINGSVGGIVVHQHFDDVGGAPHLWNGKGLSHVPGGVAIIKPSMGIRFTLKDPVQLSRGAASALRNYGNVVDQLMATLPQSTKDRIKTYFNQYITGQTKAPLHEWLKSNVSDKQYQALVGDDFSGALFAKDAQGKATESPGYTGLKAIWNAIYAFKQNLAEQLEPQVQGLEQYVNGTPAGEGFVFPTPQGLVKIVNRSVFSAANFAKMR